MRTNIVGWIIACGVLSVGQGHTETLLFLGDSLTAGYGVSKAESYPQILLERLQVKHPGIQIVNGAESGTISSSLKPRFEFYLKRLSPDIVIVAAGGNDARQMAPVKSIKQNLAATIKMAQTKKIRVLLAGMKVFPNLGKEYGEEFSRLYVDLARNLKVPMVPFLLEGVAGKPEFNQADGFHPNAKGHQKIAELLLPYLEKMLK